MTTPALLVFEWRKLSPEQAYEEWFEGAVVVAPTPCGGLLYVADLDHNGGPVASHRYSFDFCPKSEVGHYQPRYAMGWTTSPVLSTAQQDAERWYRSGCPRSEWPLGKWESGPRAVCGPECEKCNEEKTS